MKNYSRQREAVLSVLCGTKSHPSAAWIYEQVRREIPNISLGTVYRNLSGLAEDGVIRKLSFSDSSVHFDGDISAHSHFYCEHCGEITDLWLDKSELIGSIEAEYGVAIHYSDFNVIGKCSKCLEKN